MTDLHPINYVETGGQFARKRRFGTYTLLPEQDGRYTVTDDWRGGRPVGYSFTVEQAEKAFRFSDDYRLTPAG